MQNGRMTGLLGLIHLARGITATQGCDQSAELGAGMVRGGESRLWFAKDSVPQTAAVERGVVDALSVVVLFASRAEGREFVSPKQLISKGAEPSRAERLPLVASP